MFTPAKTYQEIFNQRADAYHKAMLNWPRARDQEFLAGLQGLNLVPGATLLDIPSGGGYLASYLPPDINIIHLETSELFAELGHAGSQREFRLCALDQLPIADNSADIAISLAGLHHTENKQPLFAELYRTLKTGGQCVIADAGEGSPTARFLDGWLNQHNSMGHQGWYLNHHTLHQLEACGFGEIRRETRHYHWLYDSREDAARYCQLMFGIDLAQPAEIEQALADSLGFEQKSDGRTGLRWQLDFITAVKF
jgi:SAM-dependent methyltransferase